MARDETSDLIVAFLIGATLGIGATLLLRSGTESRSRRVVRDVGALPGRGRRGLRAVRDRLADAGRETVSAFRDEMAGVVDSARAEVVRTARDAVREARRTVRKGRG